MPYSWCETARNQRPANISFQRIVAVGTLANIHVGVGNVQESGIFIAQHERLLERSSI
ncbi:hypothetical protein AAVH_18424, partial [Aphelenchoides avenae]